MSRTYPALYVLVVWSLAMLLLAPTPTQAQDLPPEIREELQRQGLSVEDAQALARRQGYDLRNPEQAVAFARSLGVPESQIQNLIERLDLGGLNSSIPATPFSPYPGAPESSDESLPDETLVFQQDVQQEAREARALQAEEADLPYFGYDLFDGVPQALQPNALASVDDAYVVGPGDELRLVVWGATELQYVLPVDREGRIFVPGVGQFTAAGRRLEVLREAMRQWLSQNYSGLTDTPPSVFMDLTLARLRPIQVYILGEVAKPGAYLLQSNATVFNALYSVGGPLLEGSLRAIDVIRNGRPVASIDLYDYLLRGYSNDEFRLQNNDRVMVRSRVSTVAIDGMVRRPAIFEVLPGETMDDLLVFSGGLLPDAYVRQFQIERIVPFAERTDPSVARTVLDLDLLDVVTGDSEVLLADGDRVTVFSIQDQERIAARSRISVVTVEGAVFKPGRYELQSEVRTVRDLIERADGLTGDAYRAKADLIRLQDDFVTEILALDLSRVLDGDPAHDVVLRPQDSLFVYSELDLRTDRNVTITGQVLSPRTLPWMDNMTVLDLLFLGGGLTDTEFLKDVLMTRADLFRRSTDGATEEIIAFDLARTLAGQGLAAERLRPEDEIRVYPARVERLTDRFVIISGAVAEPDTFRYRDNMTLEDLILQAEGFREDAYLVEVEITRPTLDSTVTGSRVQNLTIPLLPNARDVPSNLVRYGVDASSLALNEARQFKLQHRDRVYIRARPDFQNQNTVTVRGEVRFPGEYTLLRENETLSEVISRAGGVLPTGYVEGGRLLRDGEQVVVEMRRALQRRGYDIILAPNDEVILPPTPNTVAVRGNVGLEGLIKFESGRRVSYYLNRAGGTLEGTEAIYLTQPSGATFRVKRGLFRTTPVVGDGAIIRVTKKPPREKVPFDLGETITDGLAIASSAVTLIVFILRTL